MKTLFYLCCYLIPLCLSAKPLFEIGVGAFVLDLPYYPGSENNKRVIAPIPIFIYRGDFFRANRDGSMQGRFFNSDKLELNISLNGTFPSNGDDNSARSGMPELDGLIEIGPSIKYYISHNSKKSIYLSIPLRYAITSDFRELTSRGVTLGTYISAKFKDIFSVSDYISISAGLRYANKQLMDYYYTVDQDYSTATRPTYYAKGGLFKYGISSGFNYNFTKDFWLYGATGYSMYYGTANEDGPLLRRKSTLTFLVSLYWNIYKSKQSTKIVP